MKTDMQLLNRLSDAGRLAVAADGPGVVSAQISNAAYASGVGLRYTEARDRRDFDGLPLNEVMVCNTSLFEQAYYQEPLTDFAVNGWNQADLAGEVASIVPTVPVPQWFQYAIFDNPTQFARDGGGGNLGAINAPGDDRRAIRGSFNQVEYPATKATAEVDERGLIVRLDRRELEARPDWQNFYTMMLMGRRNLNILTRVYNALAAVAVTTNRNWAAGQTVDPDGDILNTLIAGQTISGLQPNVVAYGKTAWLKRKLAYRQDPNQARFNASLLPASELKDVLGVDSVVTSQAFFQASATAKNQILGSNVLSYYAQRNPTRFDPSNIKLFVANTEGGSPVRAFLWPAQETGKTVTLGIEYRDYLAVTYTGGIRLDTVA